MKTDELKTLETILGMLDKLPPYAANRVARYASEVTQEKLLFEPTAMGSLASPEAR